MTTAMREQQEVTPSRTDESGSLEALRQLHAELLRQVSSSRSKRDVLVALAELVPRYAQPEAMFYFERDPQGRLLETIRLHPAEDSSQAQRLAHLLSSACQMACRHGTLEVRRLDGPERLIVAAPVFLRGRDPEAVGFIFSADKPVEQLIMLVQIVASQLVLWHVLAAARESEQDARDSAALIELLDAMGAASDLRSTCFALAADLQTHSKCLRVAVGLRPRGRGRCRLLAISGVAQFDLRSRTACAIEAAMDEAVLRNQVTTWPTGEVEPHQVALTHKNLCTLEEARAAVSMPLHDRDCMAIGVLMLLYDSTDMVTRSRQFLQASERSIAAALDVAMRLEGGRLVRFGRMLSRTYKLWQGKIALMAGIMVAASMAIPLPHRLHCNCQVEPVTRRFISAPFEGTLEKSLVKPGDIVREGDLLARMDGREIRWKRASVVADQSQAIKKRDAAQAIHNYAEMQIAALEVERLELELRLLDHRGEHLEIKSPVTGIVVTGDLERAEGAPLVIGQTLFEIAPLEQMVVEVAVPDAEVSFVRPGQPITVRLDSYPHDTWQAQLSHVFPRSEIRDEKNVFIAEADLDNPDGQFSPGMKGRANVEAGHRPLGWILFHKPWEFVTKTLSW